LLEFGATLISRLATPLRYGAAADAELLELTVAGGDRDAYTAAQIEAADAALVVITEIVGEAGRVMDGYLGQRYALPLAETTVSANPLETYCERIALYLLHRQVNRPESVRQDYSDAMAWLRDVSGGRVKLLEPDNEGETVAVGGFAVAVGGSTVDSMGMERY
jgi:phage gp36-like protein